MDIMHSLISNLGECLYSVFHLFVVYVLFVYNLIEALMPFSGQLTGLVWIFVSQRCQSLKMALSFNPFVILMSGTPSLRAEMTLIILVSYLNAELWFKCTPGVRAIELWTLRSQY